MLSQSSILNQNAIEKQIKKVVDPQLTNACVTDLKQMHASSDQFSKAIVSCVAHNIPRSCGDTLLSFVSTVNKEYNNLNSDNPTKIRAFYNTRSMQKCIYDAQYTAATCMAEVLPKSCIMLAEKTIKNTLTNLPSIISEITPK